MRIPSGPLALTATLTATMLAAAVGASRAAPAEKEGLPTAESILARYVEVTGGEAAYRKVKNRRMVGTFAMQANQVGTDTVKHVAVVRNQDDGSGKFEERFFQDLDGAMLLLTNAL